MSDSSFGSGCGLGCGTALGLVVGLVVLPLVLVFVFCGGLAGLATLGHKAGEAPELPVQAPAPTADDRPERVRAAEAERAFQLAKIKAKADYHRELLLPPAEAP